MVRVCAEYRSEAPEGALARLVIRRADRPAPPVSFDSVCENGTVRFRGELEENACYFYTLASYFEGAAVNFEEHARIYVGSPAGAMPRNAGGNGGNVSVKAAGSALCIEIRGFSV